MKPRLATIWLGGCSGCHMSLLDLDEALLDLMQKRKISPQDAYDFATDKKVFERG